MNNADVPLLVMAGLVPAIHRDTPLSLSADEMPGTSPGMTV